jgi:UDP-N-acetylglucosamine 2-epimerase (non-hydrolysing)
MARADLLFAPSVQAAENLVRSGARGRIHRIEGNTVVDALRLAQRASSGAPVPRKAYALATCHRLETISRGARLRQVVQLLNRFAERLPVVLVVHAPTARALRRHGLDSMLHPRVQQLPLQDYFSFVTLLRGAKLVLSDGGSIQEECAVLGKPCLILRGRTERPDGLGVNARLWNFDDAVAERFWEEAEDLATGAAFPPASPSAQLIEALLRMGFGGEHEQANPTERC